MKFQLLSLLMLASTAFAITPELVWVGKTDSAMACDKKKGVALEVAAKELSKLNVKIFGKQKIHDENPRIQMCGISKGDMNGFLIQKSESEKAVAVGFVVLDPQPKIPVLPKK